MQIEAGRSIAEPDGSARSPVALSNVDDAAPAIGGQATGVRCGSPAPVSTIPTLLVFLDDDFILHWKPDDVKGARWRNSKSDSIGEVCRQADEVMPDRYNIDYVTSKE